MVKVLKYLFKLNLVKPNFFIICHNSFLIRKYTHKCISIVKEINPNLVRSFNNFLEGYLAYKIFKSLNIPYVILFMEFGTKIVYIQYCIKFVEIFKKYEKISL